MTGPVAITAPGTGRLLVLGLVGVVVLLDVAFVTTLAVHRFGPDITDVKLMFDLGREGNVPTWANTVLLVLVATASFVLAALSLPSDRPTRRSLVVVGVVVMLLSVDEATQLHELAGAPTNRVLGRLGIDLPTYAWVVPGSILVVTAAVVAWRWAATLPDVVRRRLTLAFVAYTGAAVGVEAVNGWLVRREAEYPYVIGTLVEESIEMIACVIALTGLAHLLTARLERLVADGATLTPSP